MLPSVGEVLKDLQRILPENISSKTPSRTVSLTPDKQQHQLREKIYPYAIVTLTALGTIVIGVEFFINPFIRPLYYLYQGNSLLDRRQPEAAIEQFEKITENLKPNSAAAWKGRGDALFSLGRYQAALASYEMANSYQPNDTKILVNTGKVLYKIGGESAYKEALDIYTKVLKTHPNNAEAWSGKGLVQLGLNRTLQASESFKKVKQLRPNDPNIWQQIGLAIEQMKGGQDARPYFEEALSSYDAILAKKPRDIMNWTDRGSVLLKLNRPQEALDSYQKAIDIEPNFYEALMGKGNTLNLLGENNYLDALIAYNQASKIRPKDYQVWYNRGMLLSQHLKRYGEAIESFDRAIKLKDNFHPAWLGKGIALAELERYQPALEAFDRAIKRQPQDPFIWANRGDTLTELKRYREARDSYQQAIDLGFPRAELKTQLENVQRLAANQR
jgi:tetratricopeptide (TPR) repeat protein